QSSLNYEKHPRNVLWTTNCYETNFRRHISSSGFDLNTGWSNGGHFGRREKNAWRSQGRTGTTNIHHCGGCYGGCSSAHIGSFCRGKTHGLYENCAPDGRTGKKEDKGIIKPFAAEDFPLLNPRYERERKQNNSSAAGVWEYPLNPKSRSPRTLVIKKGCVKEVPISGFPVAGSPQPIRTGTGASAYKGFFLRPVIPSTKPKQWKLQARENKSGIPFPRESAYGVDNFSPFRSSAKVFTISQNPVKECNWSNSSSHVDKVGQPHLTKLTRMRTAKREFLRTLKQVKVEGKHDSENDAGQEKEKKPFNLCNSNSPCHESDINQNLENKVLQDNSNASVTFQQVIQSSVATQTDALSSSLEAEHR
ncbi:GPBP1 protein, partial [Eubucco bourcierii]|nr:GPBP1 protein [Eubucco bourcierii]